MNSTLDIRAPIERPAPTTGPPLVVARDLSRVWGRGDGAQTALDSVSVQIHEGEVVALVGPSGSGKSTLGALLAGLDRPTSGSIVAAGERIDRLSDDRLARWRARHVAVVFQDFHLIPTLTARENVELALRLGGQRRGRRRRATAALDQVGLGAKATRLPTELSGGEQQRVAVARALAVRPALLVADEPTGALDQATGAAVFEQLLAVRDDGATVVFITHDEALAAAADRRLHLIDGRLVADDTTGAVR
ncbi:MAG: ABC transporter ATP-binding protein [Actinomycetota bacterium]